MRALRNGLFGAGIAVENTKSEADIGQVEVNIRYAPALTTADTHTLTKAAAKEIAHDQGLPVTFMAKYDTAKAGSSSHILQSLWSLDGLPAFRDPSDDLGMSPVMKHLLAGQLAHARERTRFLAPYVNSYKRFCTGLFAPTKAVWSPDNRTAGFRVCGKNSSAVRVECRIGGADLNPDLACAALLAAGLEGIEQAMPLEPATMGNMYATEDLREIPASLSEAVALADVSNWLRAALGDAVVDHYCHAARWEISESERAVTDRTLAALPITARALDVLETGGPGRAVFAQVDANPTEANLLDGIEVCREGERDGWWAFGGGSRLDLGKMIALMAGQRSGLSVWQLEDVGDCGGRAPMPPPSRRSSPCRPPPAPAAKSGARAS